MKIFIIVTPNLTIESELEKIKESVFKNPESDLVFYSKKEAEAFITKEKEYHLNNQSIPKWIKHWTNAKIYEIDIQFTVSESNS